jgi:hypothetical protein
MEKITKYILPLTENRFSMVPPFGLFSAQKDETKKEPFFQDIRQARQLSNSSIMMPKNRRSIPCIGLYSTNKNQWRHFRGSLLHLSRLVAPKRIGGKLRQQTLLKKCSATAKFFKA